ncbi:DUF4296 domain-containing protein [uncultured Psychroserpens sp.]|uniref:DUF4296 domain-containing protein n=1 Tax=uncultured Psychroserpens sp. TaxID=255436 RepID=UPI002610E405|nr:DUF4296 domain-containing protein [uncultured Psychroserpens sp.]
MIKHIYILILLFSLCSSCNKIEKPEKPDDLISEAKMVDILYDVFIINAAKGTSRLVLERNGVHPDDYVYKKHQIDSAQFAASNNYYSYDLKIYESILNKVDARIEVNTAKYKKEIELEDLKKKARQDSISKLPDSLKKKLNKDFKKTKLKN